MGGESSLFFIPNICRLCLSGYPEYSASEIDLHGAVREGLRERDREQNQRSLRAVSCVRLYFHVLPATKGKSPRLPPWFAPGCHSCPLIPSSWKQRKTNRSLFYVFLKHTVHLKVRMCPGLFYSASWIVPSGTADFIQQPLRFLVFLFFSFNLN